MSLNKLNTLHITSKTRCIKHLANQLKSSANQFSNTTTSSPVLVVLF